MQESRCTEVFNTLLLPMFLSFCTGESVSYLTALERLCVVNVCVCAQCACFSQCASSVGAVSVLVLC